MRIFAYLFVYLFVPGANGFGVPRSTSPMVAKRSSAIYADARNFEDDDVECTSEGGTFIAPLPRGQDPFTQISNMPSDQGKLFSADGEISKLEAVLERAAETKTEDSDAVVAALVDLEKIMRKKNKADGNQTSLSTFSKLKGDWRLIFTTGTADTQKKLGRINYFPLKAVQSFDTLPLTENDKVLDEFQGTLTNGIFVGDTAVLQFSGDFTWALKSRKLEFDFDRISLFGGSLSFNLPKGGAAKIGSSTGLGSESNEQLISKGAKPFFNWVLASEKIAVARGGGGGLALWKREV